MRVAEASILLVLAFRPSQAEGADPSRITLADALRLAEASPAGRTIALEVERARAEVRGAGLWANPDLSLSREDVPGAIDRFATVSVPLPIWGRLSLEKSAAGAAARAAAARGRQDRVELRSRVRERFLNLLAAQARLAALEAALTRVDELVRVLRAREKEGESSGFDRRRVERERAEGEADVHEERARVGRARATLGGLLALPSEGLVAEGALAVSGALPGFEEVRERAAARADVDALRIAAEGEDTLARAASRRRIPEPVLSAGFKSTEVDKSSERGSVLGLSFSLPLFDRGQGLRAVAEAEGALLRARREALVHEAMAEAEAALSEAQSRREAEAAYASAPPPEELLRIARTAYEEGEMRILELLDAYRTAVSVELRLVDLRAEARRAEIGLDRATGH